MFWKILKALIAFLAAFIVLWVMASTSKGVNFIVAAVTAAMVYFVLPNRSAGERMTFNKFKGITLADLKTCIAGLIAGIAAAMGYNKLVEGKEDPDTCAEMTQDEVVADGKLNVAPRVFKYLGWGCYIVLALACVTAGGVFDNLVE